MESIDNKNHHLGKNDKTLNEWQRYFDITQTLKSENDFIVFDLNLTLLMGENLLDFWRYQGSLTTPPCTEGIIWTMFRKPIVFLEHQFKTLRDNIYFEDYRGPQPLYNRTVYRNFYNETVSPIPDYNRCLLDSQDEIIKRNSYSFLFLMLGFYSIIVIVIFTFCKSRFASERKKFE